jgi:hypothetical protein
MSSPKLFKQIFSTNSGSDALAYAAADHTFPTGTITVYSTSGFLSSGSINVITYSGNVYSNQTITYTSINATQFLGCSGGSGTMFVNQRITQFSNVPIITANWTAPPGVKWVTVTGCGGGGGGGGGASVSSSNASYPFFVWCIAGGGGGGQAAITGTHVVAVTPGVSYPISIGLGGVGGTINPVWNGNPYTGTPLYPNNYGGATWGNAGSNGQSSLFGSAIFTGGQGGRRGEILQRTFTTNEIKYSGINFGGDDPIGATVYNGTVPAACGGCPAGSTTPFPNPVLGGQTVQARTYGIWNPPGIATSTFTLDQVLTIGLINNSQSLVANAAAPGLSNLWSPGTGGSGGGGGGGGSNNIYSYGGSGGQGAQGFAGYPFSTGGNSGIYGGGGGGGGGGEGINYNNTHDGSFGGNGGSGFIEISWIQ